MKKFIYVICFLLSLSSISYANNMNDFDDNSFNGSSINKNNQNQNTNKEVTEEENKKNKEKSKPVKKINTYKKNQICINHIIKVMQNDME